ncbi:Hypothetical protein DAL_139 [Psychrobacter phage D'Alembert]|nr:Hypothetical protein DAL_139 [Psychrobacter phage D'Alembert]
MSPLTLKLGDKLLCKYDFPMSYVYKGGEYTFKSYDSALEGFINLVEHEGRYSMDCFEQIDTCNQHELSWTHEGDALVSVMLQEGFKYIMCEIGEEDKQYFKDEIPIFIIESQDGGGFFIDVDGNMWQSVQAINNDGTVMTYNDYFMLKQLREMNEFK